MKTLSRSTKLLVAVIVVLISVATFVTFADTKKPRKVPKDNSVRLRMGGHGDKEPLHCTRDSLTKALKDVPKSAYKVHHHKKGATDLNDGDLPDVDANASLSSAAREIGGAEPASAGNMIFPSGSHTTQTVTFSDIEQLKAFVGALEIDNTE